MKPMATARPVCFVPHMGRGKPVRRVAQAELSRLQGVSGLPPLATLAWPGVVRGP